MAALAGRELILGVTGSIAAYKAAYLLRELRRQGAGVSVCLTEAAARFVAPLTFRTLSGRPVLTDLFDPQSPEAVEHVALAERADAVLVAPATANLLAKAAHGIADDFLTTMLLAARGRVVMAPAMDGGMWLHPAVIANVSLLRQRGVTVLEPGIGVLRQRHVLDRLQALRVEEVRQHRATGERPERQGPDEPRGVLGEAHGHPGPETPQLAQQVRRLVGGDRARHTQDQLAAGERGHQVFGDSPSSFTRYSTLAAPISSMAMLVGFLWRLSTRAAAPRLSWRERLAERTTSM